MYFSCRLLHWVTLAATCACILLVVVNHVYFTQVQHKPQLLQLMETLNYVSGWVLRQWPLYYYFTCIILLTVRMWYLNKRISKLNLLKMTKQEIGNELMTVRRIHKNMCHVCKCLNITYSMPMVGNIFMTTIFMVIGILTFFGFNSARQSEIMFWGFGNVSITWSIIIVCHFSTYIVGIFLNLGLVIFFIIKIFIVCIF